MNSSFSIRRVAYFPFGTYGIIYIPEIAFTCYTVELPWKDNHKMVSCIPEGTYELEPHNSAEHPDTWAFVNHELGVYHLPDASVPDSARTACLLHPDNTPLTLAGCVGMGRSLAFFSGLLGVTNSIDTFGKLHGMIKLMQNPTVRIYSEVSKAW